MVYDGLKVVHFVFRADEVARAVEAETAYAGERARDDAGRVMVDEIVMDEEYGVLFRRLFLEARARVLQVAGSRARVTGFPRFDAADFDEERDFCFCLEEMDDAGARVVDALVMDLLVYRVAGRWLEGKLPGLAGTFLERAEEAGDAIKRCLVARGRPGVIRGWIA
jgi:hypothetical protein